MLVSKKYAVVTFIVLLAEDDKKIEPQIHVLSLLKARTSITGH